MSCSTRITRRVGSISPERPHNFYKERHKVEEEKTLQEPFRMEKDMIGERPVPASALYGINTARALDNFMLSGNRVHAALVRAFGSVKLAAAQTNRSIGVWEDDPVKADAIEAACREMMDGKLDAHFSIDALQGGAGTSTNMNANEVLANRALQMCGRSLGDYKYISPLEDINRHQSTNDTYPTALKLAAIWRIRELEKSLSHLVEAFQNKEKEFAEVIKIGRTELQDAVPISLGREMAAYAAAFGRDRWRLSKCEERLRAINLGGTAVGTGIAAPRSYIFRVSETLRSLTGIGFSRAEDLLENTQNADVFVEVSGFLKACATSLIKCCTDLRLLSSGPEAGLGEIKLPALQMGSSLMPGKVNPVIPEAVTQAAMRVLGYDLQISMAAAGGNLELNPFMPLIADSLLASIDLLVNACDMLRTRCIDGIVANKERCRKMVEESSTLVTALVSRIGYTRASDLVKLARAKGLSIRQCAIDEQIMTDRDFDELIKPEAILRLGQPDKG